MVKIEPHCHTYPASKCAKKTVEETVLIYKKLQYNAIVLTNHYTYYDNIPRQCDEIFEKTANDYYSMKKIGDIEGIKIFFGIELKFYNSRNDYLVYGITPNELYEMGAIYEMNLEEFYYLKYENTLIYQAHPFRSYNEPANQDFLDGLEIYNGNPSHESNNHIAKKWAKENNLLRISGSDFHYEDCAGRGGILLKNMPKDEHDLSNMLKHEKIKYIENN